MTDVGPAEKLKPLNSGFLGSSALTASVIGLIVSGASLPKEMIFAGSFITVWLLPNENVDDCSIGFGSSFCASTI